MTVCPYGHNLDIRLTQYLVLAIKKKAPFWHSPTGFWSLARGGLLLFFCVLEILEDTVAGAAAGSATDVELEETDVSVDFEDSDDCCG